MVKCQQMLEWHFNIFEHNKNLVLAQWSIKSFITSRPDSYLQIKRVKQKQTVASQLIVLFLLS